MQSGLLTLVEDNSTPQAWLEKAPVALGHPFRSKGVVCGQDQVKSSEGSGKRLSVDPVVYRMSYLSWKDMPGRRSSARSAFSRLSGCYLLICCCQPGSAGKHQYHLKVPWCMRDPLDFGETIRVAVACRVAEIPESLPHLNAMPRGLRNLGTFPSPFPSFSQTQ